MVKRAVLIFLALSSLFTSDLGAQQSEAARKLFRETKDLADKGDAQSQFSVAGYYASGMGVVADPKKAFKYYQKAAEQGLVQAQFQLGLNYVVGEGTKQDPEEAVYWYTKAAEQGMVEAQVELGRCFLTGKGVKANGLEAVRWFRKAAAQGSIAAQYYIGKCYFEGVGVSRDIEEAVKWTRRAAEAGNPLAQNTLGGCYERGTGVEKDLLQAYKWYVLAAAQDDANAPDIHVSIAKVEISLTKEQVAEAQRLAREFKPFFTTASPDGVAQRPTAEPDFGFVTVTAEDGQSEVFTDGSFVGNAPAKLKLKEGAHVIEVKRAGFKDYRREIKITSGSDLNLRALLERQ